jgi:hypothetical protein
MALALGVTDRQITRWQVELEQADWIIVIYRRNEKTGRRCGSFYHVFEVQEECREWRTKLNLPKPERVTAAEARKKKPASPIHLTPMSDGESDDHVTPMSDGYGSVHVTPMSGHDPDSLKAYPDPKSIDATHLGPPDTVISEKSIDPTRVQPDPPPAMDAFRELQVVVNEVYKHDNPAMFGVSGDIAHMLLGNSDKAAYQTFNFQTPATPAEVRAFGAWWGKKRDRDGHPLTFPKLPQAINEQLHEFRAAPEYHRQMAALNKPDPSKPYVQSDEEFMWARILKSGDDAQRGQHDDGQITSQEVSGERSEPDTLAA